MGLSCGRHRTSSRLPGSQHRWWPPGPGHDSALPTPTHLRGNLERFFVTTVSHLEQVTSVAAPTHLKTIRRLVTSQASHPVLRVKLRLSQVVCTSTNYCTVQHAVCTNPRSRPNSGKSTPRPAQKQEEQEKQANQGVRNVSQTS